MQIGTEEYRETMLEGHVRNASGYVDRDFVKALEALMIKHRVNSVHVGWSRFTLAGDRYAGS